MEIMGLALVLVLIVLGMLFALRFFVNREPVDYKARFTQKQLAQNTVTAFLNTNTSDCYGMSVTELLQDCRQSQSVTCGEGSGSCEYVEDVAAIILYNTFEQWNLKYGLLVYKDAENPVIELGPGCSGELEPGWGYTPTTTGTIFTRLDVCG